MASARVSCSPERCPIDAYSEGRCSDVSVGNVTCDNFKFKAIIRISWFHGLGPFLYTTDMGAKSRRLYNNIMLASHPHHAMTREQHVDSNPNFFVLSLLCATHYFLFCNGQSS